MINRFPGIQTFLFLAASLGVFSNAGRAMAQPVNVEAAKKDASVVVYGTATPQAMDVIIDG